MKLAILLLFTLSLWKAAEAANVAIPKPQTPCTAKVTFPVKATGMTTFTHVVYVFGIPILATAKFAKATESGKNKLQHVASVMAELLDNNNDGCADDPNVLANTLKNRGDGKKSLRCQDTADQALTDKDVTELINKGYYDVQNLGEEETHPSCSGLNMICNGKRDATVEEVLHMINGHGHVLAYPKVFANKWSSNSDLTKAMDEARGKRIKVTPSELSEYPKKAWYTYTDTTCTYDCQAIEYLWWGYAAYTGAGNKLSTDASYRQEFHVLKQNAFKAKDKKLTKIYDDSKSGSASYRLPTQIVDGIYTGCKVCKAGTNHGGA